MMKLSLIVLLVTIVAVEATHESIKVCGTLRCNKNPIEHFDIIINAYDDDSFPVLDYINSDDFMG